ncbi:MAG: M48 family metalloprotease [Okeania sp. SIO3B5]|uniref:zinc metalloprotease HtpX n=1 Tax=Okeania sp. SIO3B5 TaxID=2607811 RepID=UPI0013FE73F6|nr:zinc metalloprotease HtpX [Okeania sp. SIO3B5]NEO57041.1 M48 family metalloprotease [Okeania sp. SIO3B5]
MATSEHSFSKLKRTEQLGAKVAIAGGGNLIWASCITLILLFAMVLPLSLALIFILVSPNPTQGLIMSVGITIAFNFLQFFFSPYLMDLTQEWLYKTRWVSLVDLEAKSPETVAVIQRVCQERNLKQPRVGIIDDQNPTAFTYGSLPNQARLVVSEGLFTYLDDEEIATVYAHELGHIVHWDFAVMTLASTLVQIIYLVYVFTRRLQGADQEVVRYIATSIAVPAYVFYLVGTYILLYLSRTREYFADHFAAETTGNPNALSRALVKIAYGIVEEAQKIKEPSQLLEGTRALGIYDAKAATSSGTAYRITSDTNKIGQVFLWDMFNPWGWWMELNSTHPLTGKRVRALSTYAEKLGLAIEFDMGRIIGEGNKLSKKRLYGNFIFDLLLYNAELISIIVGLVIGFLNVEIMPLLIISAPIISFGLGHLIKTSLMYPDFKNAVETDVLTLMSDPYASPLRGKPAQLQGELIGRGDAGYKFGSDLKLQDKTGMIYLHYASRFGAIGNFLFGMKRVKSLIGMNVKSLGWFRRGVAPWMDLIQLSSEHGTVVNSYHRFWSFVLSIGAIVFGVLLLVL